MAPKAKKRKTKGLEAKPGNANNQKAHPFYVTKGNEKETAAYLGFKHLAHYRTYIASDRFRPFFEIYQRWQGKELLSGFKVKKVLDILSDPAAKERNGYGRGSIQEKWDLSKTSDDLSRKDSIWNAVADLLVRIYWLSTPPDC